MRLGYFAITTEKFHFSLTLKSIEKFKHQRLNEFLEDNRRFYPQNFGRRLNLSTLVLD